jgi:uncharacterized protein (DUF302 family)
MVMMKKFEVERVSLVSSKPFEEITAILETAIAHPGVAEMYAAIHASQSASDMENTIVKAVGGAGLMLFFKLDHGVIVRNGSSRKTPKIVRFIIGNPLIMREMARHVPDAGAYAPVTVLVDERDDGVHLSYDRMVSFLAPYENAAALEVARNLDAKVESLLRRAAG